MRMSSPAGRVATETVPSDRRLSRPHGGVAKIAALLALAIAGAAGADGASPYAASVVSYAPGANAVLGYTNPTTSLGMPERSSGEPFAPACVTPFAPAWGAHELVSIGVGGHLVVAFDHDVVDDPDNPHGIDLIVFSNAFFTDAAPPFGVVAGLVGEGGTVSVSPDGARWTSVPGVAADGAFPTLGYLDVGPYATLAGAAPSDFLRPVDPALSVGDFLGLDHEACVELYDGSGGGAGIDLGALGLDRIRFVRFDGPAVPGFSAEIDAVSDVAPARRSPDLDASGAVDAGDLAVLLAAWGSPKTAADLDGDGAVGAGDLSILLAAWANGGGA